MKKIKIGNILIENQIVLAPMAGISNPSYLKIIEKMGAGLAFTELISAEAIVRNNKKTFKMLKGLEKLRIPIGIQIFGSDVKVLTEAAQIITNLYKNAFIDINMGCPVPKVAIKSQAGSSLLKNPTKIKEIVASVVKAVDVPVTVKIRSGWDSNSINAIEVAKVCEKAGASAITIHARTRAQGYTGKADWDIIKKIKQEVKIPVIGNGDVTSCYLAEKMLKETGCDAVMIGRGVLGNPWIIKECVDYLNAGIKPRVITKGEKIDMLKKHYQILLEDTNEKQALLEIRSHALWYLKGLEGSAKIKNQICQSKTSDELFDILDAYNK